MSNIVGNLIQDIQFRINDVKAIEVPGPSLLIKLNEAYHSLNLEYRCLEKLLTIPEDTFDDDTTSYPLPSDWIEPFLIVPGATSKKGLDYIQKEDWNPTQHANYDVYTILNDELVFGNVGADTSFEFYYYASGLELVDEDDDDVGDATIYTNTPEWKAMYHPILIYETLLKLGLASKMDMALLSELRESLRRSNKNRQSTGPVIIGGRGIARPSIDPDYLDGLWITRRRY